MWRLQPVIDEIRLDEGTYKIIGFVEDTSEHKKNLIEYVDDSYLHLKGTLDDLVERAVPEESLEERRKRDREALTRGKA